MIDLKNKPFYLKNEDIRWVEETLAGMDLDAKIGQLFCLVGLSEDIGTLEKTLQALLFWIFLPANFLLQKAAWNMRINYCRD